MKLTLQGLASVDLETMRPFVRDSEWFYAGAGVEGHRLLAYLSTMFENRTLFDIGTHYGDSAHALAYNAANRVLSLDVVDKVPAHRRRRGNIAYHLVDLFDSATREAWKSRLLDSALIFVDVDPHDGVRERELVAWLCRNEYRGVVVLD